MVTKNKNNTKNLDSFINFAKQNMANPIVKEAVKKLAKKDPVNVMASIIRTQASLYKKEIAHFIAARANAKDVYFPNRQLLMAFYDDIDIDPFIFGMKEKRINKIANKQVKINNPQGNIDPEKTKLLHKKWFWDFCIYAMQSKFYGYSLVYAYLIANNQIQSTKLVYREHVLPNKNLILKNPTDTNGIDFTKTPYSNYCIGIGDPEDLGIYEKAAVLYILKKHSWGNWDEFEEIFGIPVRIAKTASQDQTVKNEIISWLQNMGSAAYGIFPADSELDIVESKTNDAFQVFYEKISAVNFELEILITGQNRVMQKGGSYAKEKAMENETDELTQADKKFMYHIFNDQLKPLLINLGYPININDDIVFDDEKQLTDEERIKIYKTLSDMGYTFDQTEIEKEFSVKITGFEAPNNQTIQKTNPKKSTAFDNFIKMHTDINKLYKS